MKTAVLVLACVMLACTGCAVGPRYAAPDAAGVPAAWHAPLPHGGTVAELSQWWRQFDDPLMASLVEAAEQGHPSIDSAVAAIRAARANVWSSRAGFLPGVSANGSATRNGSTSSGELAGTGGIGSGGGIATSGNGGYTLYSGSVDASWELDLFGGQGRAYEADRARLSAAQADWHEARVSLAAEVADAYVQRRYCERLVALYRETLQSRRETERLTGLKLKAGFVAPADGNQALASVYDSENRLAAQEGVCAQDLNQLVALTGIPAAALQQRLATEGAAAAADGSYRSGIPVPLSPAVPGVPASILSQRPDLMSAERSVAAASADIGVAVASRLPSLTLIGSIGVNRIEHVDGSTRSWSWGPSLNLPLFEGGAGRARVEASKARYDLAMAGYRGQVLTAVQEVEDALVRVDTSTRRADAARLAEENYSLLLASQENRYRLGATSLLDLEDSRRLALASRESLAAVQLEISRSWIALYKAVGGGWNDVNGTLAPEASKTPPERATNAGAGT